MMGWDFRKLYNIWVLEIQKKTISEFTEDTGFEENSYIIVF